MKKKNAKVKKQVKDRLFRFLFDKDRDALLQLYNALNGTNYTDVSKLQVVTIESAVYVTMKNDLAFVIAGVLNLYEHQSTLNPNMPLRFLIYLAQEYQKLVEEAEKNLYGSKRISLPTPQCIVFYNGKSEMPEEQILRLSDLFENKSVQAAVELRVRMLNINYGYNKALMRKCRILEEYARFVEISRECAIENKDLNLALNEAVDYCIHNDILSDFLSKYSAEVVGMLLEEFDKEKYEKDLKAEGFDKGYETGHLAGIIKSVDELMSHMDIDLSRACELLGVTVDEYLGGKNKDL